MLSVEKPPKTPCEDPNADFRKDLQTHAAL